MRRLLTLTIMIVLSSPVGAGYLTRSDIAKIARNRPDYERGADRAGVPWLALAAIHMRESDLVRNPGNIGGSFMLDCGGKTGTEFERRIRAHEEKTASRYGIYFNPSVEDNFRFACLVAADELRTKVRGRLYYGHGLVDDDVLADALWGYNGRCPAQVGPDGKAHWKYSPCVYSDPRRGRRLLVRYTRRDGTVKCYLDNRPGTLVLYREMETCTVFR